MDFLKSNTVKIFIIIIAVLVVVIIAFSLFSRTAGSTAANEKSLIRAAKKYFDARPNILPKTNYESATVTMSTLVSNDYIKETKGKTCFSYVTVVKSGSDYIYNPYVKCNDDSDTKLLLNKVISNVTTHDDGVYKVNEEYIYKGENPDNYISFSEELWRIIKIDKEDIIKIIYNGENEVADLWDDRYNLETDQNSGINDYKVSRVFSYLKSFINDKDKFNNEDRAKLSLANLCIGKRKETEASTDGSVECSNVLEKQMIGLLQANEYFNSSNDKNCSTTAQQVCQNYNFLAHGNFWTITGVAENTSEVYRIRPSKGLDGQSAQNYEDIHPVLYLKSDTAITGGKGTEEDPYVIR